MSTPIVAGNAAMARQYFREGWYNTGSKNLTLGFDPSAALLKAVLVNSAAGMDLAGVNPDASTLDITLSDPPDKHQVRNCGVLRGIHSRRQTRLFSGFCVVIPYACIHAFS